MKISGGGRCNVTHACFDVKDLINIIQEGQKELQPIFIGLIVKILSNGLKKRRKIKTETMGGCFRLPTVLKPLLIVFSAN